MDSIGDNAAQVMKFWMDVTTKAATAGATLDPFGPPADNARQLRSAIFAAMSESADEFMRSPQFLEFMKKSSEASLDFRAKLNEFMTAMRHDSQGVAREDIDSMMVNMRHMYCRILDRMETIGNRLDAISARLDALEGNGKSKTPSPHNEAVEALTSQPPAEAPVDQASAAELPTAEINSAEAEAGGGESTPEKPQPQPRRGRPARNR